MSYAAIFPGQGAATPGAGKPWADHAAWQVVVDAEAATGRPLGRLLLDADADELSTTGASQLAVLLTSLVGWRALGDAIDEAPVAFAGHSLRSLLRRARPSSHAGISAERRHRPGRAG